MRKQVKKKAVSSAPKLQKALWQVLFEILDDTNDIIKEKTNERKPA